MERINTKKFVSVFKDIHNSSTDRRFCFILGAGASKSSGIPTGFDLAKEWFDEIKERETKEDFDKWVKQNKIQPKNIGDYYGLIYKQRFELDVQSGYDVLNKKMEKAEPSFGYSVLAQLLSTTHHNIVITTNFDSLMEEALFTFSYKRPLVCGHESLTGYAKASIDRPLIAKIHRDLLLYPMSNPDDIKVLAKGWDIALDGVFNSSIPVVIGYGGNDGSLMGYLKNKTGLGNFFWCVRKGELPKKQVEDLLKVNTGKLVEIDDFDSLMFDLLEALDLNLLDKELENTSKKRVENYRDSVQKIKNSKGRSPDKVDREAAKKLYQKAEKDTPWNFILRAESEKDNIEKKKILEDGLKKFPTDLSLLNQLGKQLAINKDLLAEGYYKKALELFPGDYRTNSNYASFLSEVKKDYDKAEEYYKKAINIAPTNQYAYNRYAIFLTDDRKNYEKAEENYIKALELNSSDPTLHCNYAIFLYENKENELEAEKHFKRALSLDPLDADTVANYACFLFVFNRNEEGKKYLDKAFELSDDEALELALWFLTFAHVRDSIKVAEVKIKQLLKSGVRTEEWDFNINVKVAIKNKHPNPAKLKEYAKLIVTPLK